jgi:hypothetical protein
MARSFMASSLVIASTLVVTTAFAAPPAPTKPGARVAQTGSGEQAPAPTPAPTTPHTKPPVEDAGTRYQRGVELYNEGDYKLALIEFERAYELSKNWRVLYNIGEVQFQLNNYGKALKSLERYLQEGGKDVPDKRRADVEKDIAGLKTRTATLTITSNVADAEVSVDDVVVGKTPLPPDLLVDAGDHRVVLSKPGYRAATQHVTLAGRDASAVAISLTKEDAPAPVVIVQPSESSRLPWVWAGWATTGALAVGAAVTAVLAVNANSKLKSMDTQPATTRSQLDDQQATRNHLALAADILTGAAIVAGGVSLYFTIAGRKSASTGTGDGPRVGATLGPGSAALSGRF